MSQSRLEITCAENGWQLETHGRVTVVEVPEYSTPQGDAQAQARLLRTVLDMLDIYPSKHDPARVKVIVVDANEHEIVL